MLSEDLNRCGRCGEGRMVSWDELDDDGRAVVRRLPANADYAREERETNHRWCTKCWYEQTQSGAYDA